MEKGFLLIPALVLGLVILSCPEEPIPEVVTPKLLPGYPACIKSDDLGTVVPPYETNSCLNTVELVYYDITVLSDINGVTSIVVHMEDDQHATMFVPSKAVHEL